MRKLTMTFTAAALMLGTMAIAANAQTQAPGAAGLHHQIQNATLFKKAACRGFGRCPAGISGVAAHIGAGARLAAEASLSNTTISGAAYGRPLFFAPSLPAGDLAN